MDSIFDLESCCGRRNNDDEKPTYEIMRLESAVLAAFLGDAASMPLHWIYDADKINDLVDASAANALFNPQLCCPYYSSKEFPDGEQALGVLEVISRQPLGVDIDGNELAVQLAEWQKSYGGRKDSMLKAFEENMKCGKRFPQCGQAEGVDAQFMSRVPIICLYYAQYGRRMTLSNLELVVRCHQNNDLAASCAFFWAEFLLEVCTKRSINSVREACNMTMMSVSNPALRKALKHVEANLGVSTHQMLLDYGKNQLGGRATMGLACESPQSTIGALHIILTNVSLTDALDANIRCGGDSCSRAAIIGAIFGAAQGVPKELAAEVNCLEEIKHLMRPAACSMRKSVSSQ